MTLEDAFKLLYRGLHPSDPLSRATPMSDALQKVLVRRTIEDRLDGYALETSVELADTILAMLSQHSSTFTPQLPAVGQMTPEDDDKLMTDATRFVQSRPWEEGGGPSSARLIVATLVGRIAALKAQYGSAPQPQRDGQWREFAQAVINASNGKLFDDVETDDCDALDYLAERAKTLLLLPPPAGQTLEEEGGEG